jgi:hypothetical protein
MAFIDCTIYQQPVSARVIYRDNGAPIIRAECGGSGIAMNSAEAIKLRDDPSRAITEAAQQHAQAKDAQAVSP